MPLQSLTQIPLDLLGWMPRKQGLALARMSLRSRQRISAIWGRWSRWEFWPPWLFYAPVALHYLWLSLRYRGLTLPASANPGMEAGGFVGESKVEILAGLSATSPGFVAEAYPIGGQTSQERLASFQCLVAQHDISFPCIVKPDVGQRGIGVKQIHTLAHAERYFAQTSAPLVLQRYAPGPHEVGVFYYRFPGASSGQIFAITEKIFPSVSGDGIRRLDELIWDDPRARIMARTYLRRLGEGQYRVPANGESVRLVEAGNHAQGCIFRDGSRLFSEALTQRMDTISQGLPGFYIGRYDIRYSCEDKLLQGEEFQIIELNGASAEATSIYDARNSLRSAYGTLFKQWNLVFAIGAANRSRGTPSIRLTELWSRWREGCRMAISYPIAD